ncbi:peptidyl-prolyl cis-trans isomerase NIMA-interacting 1 [Rhipicephalus sanguineus]|uniref:Peptidyl-prolyl cis-trans isomerase n=1 Tax=Rhipicephalus sanguineus TaxID=34632 RepID=A0A9D4PVE1_RHISA|nr:peptidyl-prolyl cis-trans isomerase NIMA-interacting 1 [Rhipicephalus sanguineus]KAH7956416.1 hypothetical protein HPB52_009255 [Rhipicephalus sanguineus]
MAGVGSSHALPTGWEERLSRSTGEVYYLNALTMESQWDTPNEPAQAGYLGLIGSAQVRCSHILVKHRESHRPFSWREERISRTRDEALAHIERYRDQIVSGEKTFEELAITYSDCNSAKRKGDLGLFGRGATQKGFEEAAFALNVGELSEPVFTESGVHLILRTA